jgi:hypothetical protein
MTLERVDANNYNINKEEVMAKELALPLNSEKENMQNKKCDYKTLAIMTLYSKMTPKEQQEKEEHEENYRYVYKNNIIEFTDEVEELSKNKIDTVIKNMRKLSKLEGNLVTAVKNQDGEICYVINYASDKDREYVTIEEDMLKFLINTGNGNVIKTYVLLKYMCAKGEKKITRSYIAQQIGLTTNSHKNLQVVSDITESLANNGFIRKRRHISVGTKEEVYYSVNSHEDWLRIKEEKKKEQFSSGN